MSAGDHLISEVFLGCCCPPSAIGVAAHEFTLQVRKNLILANGTFGIALVSQQGKTYLVANVTASASANAYVYYNEPAPGDPPPATPIIGSAECTASGSVTWTLSGKFVVRLLDSDGTTVLEDGGAAGITGSRTSTTTTNHQNFSGWAGVTDGTVDEDWGDWSWTGEVDPVSKSFMDLAPKFFYPSDVFAFDNANTTTSVTTTGSGSVGEWTGEYSDDAPSSNAGNYQIDSTGTFTTEITDADLLSKFEEQMAAVIAAGDWTKYTAFFSWDPVSGMADQPGASTLEELGYNNPGGNAVDLWQYSASGGAWRLCAVGGAGNKLVAEIEYYFVPDVGDPGEPVRATFASLVTAQEIPAQSGVVCLLSQPMDLECFQVDTSPAEAGTWYWRLIRVALYTA